jgi:hypothetical protein
MTIQRKVIPLYVLIPRGPTRASNTPHNEYKNARSWRVSASVK